MGKRIVVVGGSGLVGSALVRLALDEGAQVTSLDVTRASAQDAHEEIVDIVTGDVDKALARARPDVVVHLVARVDPPRGGERAAMRSLHIRGLERTMAAACAHGVKRFVLASSSVVYGAHPDNPVPLTENSPRRPRADFPYAIDKAAQEDLLQKNCGHMSVAFIRPAVIYAENAKNYLTEILRYAPKVLPAVDGNRPPLQFVHADDVASALWALSQTPAATGAFNVGADVVSYDEVARLCGLRVFSLPRRLLAPAANFGASFLPAHLRAPAYVLDQLAYPFVVDTTRLREACAWAPSYSSADSLVDMLRGRRSFSRSSIA